MAHNYLTSLSYLPSIFVSYYVHNKPYSMVDFGAGYGFWFYILRANNMLPEKCVGIDSNIEFCQEMKRNIKEVNTIHGDITHMRADAPDFDCAVCNHVIEYTLDDKAVVDNIHGALKEGGILYISSIVRLPFAWWWHVYDGEMRLSSMHVREYESLQKFVDLIQNSGFRILQANESQYKMQWWRTPCGILKGKLGLPIPGFKRVEVLAEKWTCTPMQEEDTVDQQSTEETQSSNTDSSANLSESQTVTYSTSAAETKPSQECSEVPQQDSIPKS